MNLWNFIVLRRFRLLHLFLFSKFQTVIIQKAVTQVKNVAWGILDYYICFYFKKNWKRHYSKIQDARQKCSPRRFRLLNLILLFWKWKVSLIKKPVAVFTKTALCANRRRTLKHVKLSRRNVVARMCIQNELKNKALSLPKTFLIKWNRIN